MQDLVGIYVEKIGLQIVRFLISFRTISEEEKLYFFEKIQFFNLIKLQLLAGDDIEEINTESEFDKKMISFEDKAPNGELYRIT